MIGSVAPMFPCARFPPPSMFTRPFEPSLTQMPQLSLSFVWLFLRTWLTLGTKMP